LHCHVEAVRRGPGPDPEAGIHPTVAAASGRALRRNSPILDSHSMVRLESVRRKSGGRIHLTPRIPKTGPVTTLCGQVLGDGAFTGTESVADCANCIRRSRDQSRISSAFFEQEEGSELLRLSLEQARGRGGPATSVCAQAAARP